MVKGRRRSPGGLAYLAVPSATRLDAGVSQPGTREPRPNSAITTTTTTTTGTGSWLGAGNWELATRAPELGLSLSRWVGLGALSGCPLFCPPFFTPQLRVFFPLHPLPCRSWPGVPGRLAYSGGSHNKESLFPARGEPIPYSVVISPEPYFLKGSLASRGYSRCASPSHVKPMSKGGSTGFRRKMQIRNVKLMF